MSAKEPLAIPVGMLSQSGAWWSRGSKDHRIKQWRLEYSKLRRREPK
jgi:hypothetical protein